MLSHVSDVNVWGGADRNYFVFVVLSILFGFFGVDHFYLRSFGTGTQKFLVNIFGLGLWYIWDVIQIVKDGQHVRTHGLDSPFDWIRGIGRGTFVSPEKQVGGGDGTKYESKKSYLVYACLAIFFGWLGADKFYMGSGWQGIAKLLSCFNIFLFLFGWLWVAWDSFHAFFMTDSLMKHGIEAPLPYSLLFSEPIDTSVFKVQEVSSDENSTKSMGTLDMIAYLFGFPAVPTFPFKEVYKEVVAPLMTPPIVQAIQSVSASAPTPTFMPTPTPTPTPTPLSPISALPTPNLSPSFQSGGGRDEKSGPGPVIAGTLTALLLAGGLKGFYDFISVQYG